MADFFKPPLIHDAVAQLSQEGQVVTNVVRPEGTRFYGYIDELEMEEGKGRKRRLHMVLYCMLAEWFDQWADDLSNMPPVNAIAQDSKMFAAEVIWREEEYSKIKSFTEVRGEEFHLDFESVHLSEGWWLDVGFTLDLTNGYPVTLYLPAEGSPDPATIGNTANQVAASLCWVTRIRPPSRLAKLHRFSHNAK